MRSGGGSHQVVGGAHVGRPVAQSLVHCVFERATPRSDRMDGCAQQLHSEYVQCLAARVFLAHVDLALESVARARGRGCNAVLTGAGFGDDASLAHAFGDQRLPDRVVDLVGAGVREVLALQINAQTQLSAHALGEVQRRRSAGVGRTLLD